jgi:hypothetical protein
MDEQEATLVFALALDTFDMVHHQSVVDALKGLTLVYNSLWLGMLARRKNAVPHLLRTMCGCPYCIGSNRDVRADHAESIDKHRKNMHHTMLAQAFYSPVRIHRTEKSVENMLNELEREHRRECDEIGDVTDDELAAVEWDGKRAAARGCHFL